jgi:hypothetical protein
MRRGLLYEDGEEEEEEGPRAAKKRRAAELAAMEDEPADEGINSDSANFLWTSNFLRVFMPKYPCCYRFSVELKQKYNVLCR